MLVWEVLSVGGFSLLRTGLSSIVPCLQGRYRENSGLLADLGEFGFDFSCDNGRLRVSSLFDSYRRFPSPDQGAFLPVTGMAFPEIACLLS